MKQKRFYPTMLFAGLLLCTIPASAQTAQSVVMTTSRAVGQSLSFTVNAGTVSVDWGDGAATNVTSTGDAAITGTLKGNTVTVSGSSLTDLNCSDCNLTAIDLSNAAALGTLHCENNELTGLSLVNNAALQALDCADNQLSVLSLSKTRNLVDLNCSGNSLTALTTSYCTGLQTLFCADNQIKSLSLTNNKNLKTLWAQNNKLTKLSLNYNPELISVLLDGNDITQVTNKGMADLTDFWCDGNAITSLDLSASPELQTLSLEDNGLSSLTLPSTLGSINSFYAANNGLSFSQMYSNLSATNYAYGTDGTFELPTAEVGVNETLDLSAEKKDVSGNAVNTTFEWQTADGTALVIGSANDYQASSSGGFRFKKAFESIYCLMTSANFPGLTLKSTALRVIDPTGITEVTKQSGFTYSTVDGRLYMTSEKTIPVSIYTVGGQQVWSGTVGTEGRCVSLGKGLYLVNGIKVLL